MRMHTWLPSRSCRGHLVVSVPAEEAGVHVGARTHGCRHSGIIDLSQGGHQLGLGPSGGFQDKIRLAAI